MQPSIDIEAAIRGCSLDVGIFGPTDQMDAALADTMFENLRNELLHIST